MQPQRLLINMLHDTPQPKNSFLLWTRVRIPKRNTTRTHYTSLIWGYVVFAAMASNLTIGCESVVILYFYLVKILQDHTITKTFQNFMLFT